MRATASAAATRTPKSAAAAAAAVATAAAAELAAAAASGYAFPATMTPASASGSAAASTSSGATGDLLRHGDLDGNGEHGSGSSSIAIGSPQGASSLINNGAGAEATAASFLADDEYMDSATVPAASPRTLAAAAEAQQQQQHGGAGMGQPLQQTVLPHPQVRKRRAGVCLSCEQSVSRLCFFSATMCMCCCSFCSCRRTQSRLPRPVFTDGSTTTRTP
jgi:hypothetical protein